MSLNYTATTDEQRTDKETNGNGNPTEEDIFKVLKSHYRLKPYEISDVKIEGMEWDRDIIYVRLGNVCIRKSEISDLLKRLDLNGK